MAGGAQQPFLNALKWLGLIDQDGNVQKVLKDMVAAKGDARKSLMRGVIESKYVWIAPLSAANATLQQLEKSFEDQGPTGSTVRKCIVFYLEAAEYAAIPVSAHFKVRGYISKTGRSTPRPSRPKGEPTPPTPPFTPSTQGATVDSLKVRYIEMLMKKAEENDDAELLDRIEKLLTAPAESE
jgi:hypothetical protein